MATKDPVTTLGETEHGVDVRDHLDFIEWVADNPEDATVEFRAAGVAEDVANRTTATISDFALGGEDVAGDREHTLYFGLPPELEDAMGITDPTDRYEAIEGALAALTACINGTVVCNAIREGIDVKDVRTRVGIPTDLRLFLGIHDLDVAEEMYGEPRIEVEVTGENLCDEDKARIAEYPKRSPVYNLVTNVQPNDPVVTVDSA